MTHNTLPIKLHPAKERELDDGFEFRQQKATKLSWIVDRRVAAPDDVSERVDQLLSLSGDGFVDVLVNVNRVLTDTHDDEFKTKYMIPFGNIILDANQPDYVQVLPHHEDKYGLLLYLHDLANEMREQGRSAGHIAAVVGYSINLIHPFMDGNGRTARIIYDGLMQGTDDTRARFSSLAKDSSDNTGSLNPNFLESYMYGLMQSGLDTHIPSTDGSYVPRIVMAASPATIRDIVAKSSLFDASLSSPFDHTHAAISHPEMSPMLACMMAEGRRTQAVGSSIEVQDGQAILNLDTFLRYATDEDWDAMHEYARHISVGYTVSTMQILAAHPDYGSELTVTINTLERGVVTLPISQLIQQIAQRQLHQASLSYGQDD